MSSDKQVTLVFFFFFFFLRCVFSPAGVQPSRAGEQEGPGVQEEGRGSGHREADLRRLLASGEPPRGGGLRFLLQNKRQREVSLVTKRILILSYVPDADVSRGDHDQRQRAHQVQTR